MTPEQYVERYGQFFARAIVDVDEGGQFCVYLVDESWGQDEDPDGGAKKECWGRFSKPDEAERLAAKLSAGIRRAREKS